MQVPTAAARSGGGAAASLLRRAYAKAAASGRGGGGGGSGGGGGDGALGDSTLQKLLKALIVAPEARARPPPRSAEELADAARRARDYSRAKMREHREWQADLSAKLRLKQAAIAALPPRLAAAAAVPDLEPFPLSRQVFTDTPPLGADGAGARQARQPAGGRRIGTKRR